MNKILILLLLFLSGFARAQSYDSLEKLRMMARDLSKHLKNDERKLAWQLKEAEKDKLYLSINPLGLLFDPVDPNITLGAEYSLTPQLSVRADLGYIYQSTYFSHSSKTRGVVFRPMIRLYSRRNLRSSFDLALHYKYVKSTVEDWIGRMPVNGSASYQEFTEFDLTRSRWGVMLFYNYQTRRFADNRCYVEFYWGLGAKYRNNINLIDQPGSVYYPSNNGGYNIRELTPTIQMGLRVVYKFPHDLFQKNKLKKTNYEKRKEEIR